MRSATTFLLLSLAILLCTPLATDASQEAQLSKFMASKIGPLPERCKSRPPSGSKEADRIAELPGQPPLVNFEQYAGYVTVNEQHGRELFYYFVEATEDAESKPLILWLNGGPGCSSLGFGAMMEIGPFRVNPDGKTLSRNEHAWNNLANVIFLESPAGVGFSRNAADPNPKTVHDGRTAEDTYTFLLGWLERFPEYKGCEFFVAGESYGGHYVPQVATVIALKNRHISILQSHIPVQQTPINLRGIFVGNPLLDNDLFNKGYLEFLWSHGVVSDEVWDDILSNGNFAVPEDLNCELADRTVKGAKIDCFNIYAPVCLQSRNGTHYSSSYLPGYDPCSEHYVTTYLNQLEVQQALRARMGNWSACLPAELDRIDSATYMVPTVRYLIDIGLRVWIFSGDFDAMCSITVTRYTVEDLILGVTKKWRPWYAPNGEVGGFVQQYEGGFTLASVRAAGHMVPTFQPQRSLVLLRAFLEDVLPPAVPPFQE